MKDYKLSEIKAECKENEKTANPCSLCKFFNLCYCFFDCIHTNIEPRDMIELPYINEIDKSKTGCYTLDGKFYEVIFRDKDGSIKVEQAESKDEAYKFLAMLKETNYGN